MFKNLQLKPKEQALVFSLGIVMFINSLALESSDVVAVSGFLSQVDVQNILYVWIIDMILIAVAASLQSLIVDRFNRIRLMQGIILVFVAAYGILRLLFLTNIPGFINFGLLFLLAEQQWMFFPLVFWVLASEVFDLTQSKRIFPLLVSFNFAGQIAGLGLAAIAPRILASLNLSNAEPLTLNMVLYLLAFVIITLSMRNVSLRETREKQGETVQEALSEGWEFVKEVLSYRYLVLSMLAAAIVVTIIDFQFLESANTQFRAAPPGSFQLFYGLYRLLVTVVGIVLQTLLVSYLMNRVSLKNMFLVFPFFMLASSAIALVPGLVAASGARGILRLVQSSVDEPVRKSFLSLVPEERRGRVSLFMDSYVFVSGVIVGCALILGVIALGNQVTFMDARFIYLGLGVFLSIIATWSIFNMRQNYDRSLLNWRLKRRQRGASVLERLEF